MNIKQITKNVQEDKEFLSWKEKNPSSILVHVFVMLDDANKDMLQIGYYDEAKEKITTIIWDNGKVSIVPEQEILKSGDKIIELNPEEIKISVEEALEIVEKERTKKMPEPIMKKFFIIQNSEHGAIYNITFFSQALRTLNMKILASNGKVIHSDVKKLIEQL